MSPVSSGTIGVDEGASGRVAAVEHLRDLVRQAFAEYRAQAAPLLAMFPGDDEMTAGLRRRFEAAEKVLALFEQALEAAAAGQGDKLTAAVDALRRVQDELGPLANFFTEGSGKRG